MNVKQYKSSYKLGESKRDGLSNLGSDVVSSRPKMNWLVFNY